MKKWLQAARLRTLPLSLSGIIVGAGLVICNSPDWIIFWLCIATATGFQVLSNFANDYGDFAKGTDNEDRIGPKRTLQAGLISKKQMQIAMGITALISLILGFYLSYLGTKLMETKFLILFASLGTISVIAAIKYTVGKNAYGYSGFGDIFVFLFFGLVAVLGSSFLINKEINYSFILLAVSIGAFSVGVLNLNNMRDEQNDKANNKNTMVVKMGLVKAKVYHIVLLYFAMTLPLIYSFVNLKSYKQFLFIFAYVFIIKHLIFVLKNKENKKFDPELKKLALSTFLFSILFLIGNLWAC